MSEPWRPGAALPALRRRAALLAAARAFFAERGVLEVETPILSQAAVTDPHIDSLATRIAGLDAPRYLSTSPEYAMKRLLAAGSGDIYQICKAFRDGERGRWHNPEFTIIEWYRVGFDDALLMDEVDALLRRLLAPYRSLAPAERLTYAQAMERHAGVDPLGASDRDIEHAARRLGLGAPSSLERDALLDFLMGAVVGPRLGAGGPCFVVDYPASQAALARLRPDRPAVAARFETYLEGIELANGFHELADPAVQRSRFEADGASRRASGKPVPPMDERLLAALAAGLPSCAGVALGFDRLAALALDTGGLAGAMAFTIDEA